MDIEGSSHAHALSRDIRMLESKVHGMVSAEAASGDGQLRTLIFPSQKGNQLMQQVTFVLQMPQHPQPGMHAFVVPALHVYAVGAKNVQFAVLDLWSQRRDHSAIFTIKKAPTRGRKN